jgi:DNA-directed RNA polymerase specialized sigma24 family protein
MGSLYPDRVHSRLSQLLRDLQAIPDQEDRAKACSELIGSIPDFQAELRKLRRDDFADLHKAGMSYGQIASAVGITRGRVKQVVDEQIVSGRLLKKTPPADTDEAQP